MARRVQIAPGITLVALPDNHVYNDGDIAVLTDEEFDEVRDELLGTVVLDLGPASDATGGEVVETTVVTIINPTQDFTVAPPSGTPVNGEHLLLRITSGPVGYTPNWNSIYLASGVVGDLPSGPLPANKTVTFGFHFDSIKGKFVLMAADPIGY